MTPASEHSILATFLLPIAQTLRLQGEDAMEVIESVGIDPASIVNSDRRVPLDAMHKLMRRCIEVTGNQSFGLMAAEQLQPQILQGLGLGWLVSDTVYDGLRRTVRFCRLMSTGAIMQLNEEGQYVHLTITRSAKIEQCEAGAIDFSVGIIARMCRLAMGEYIAPVKIEMERPTPVDVAQFESILCCPITFGQKQSRLTFYIPDILMPLATGDPDLARVNDAQAQGYIDSFLVHNTTRKVVEKIVETLPDGAPNQQQIAETLNMSNRTLQRKLKSEGTSFLDLLQSTRMQLARRYLLQPARSVVETSYLLGFSEPSTFSRAFKRWTGQAPADFKEHPVH